MTGRWDRLRLTVVVSGEVGATVRYSGNSGIRRTNRGERKWSLQKRLARSRWVCQQR
jgi:hypothetical protein